jgi:DNA-binding NarL/FixJ family response regulator
MRSNCGPPSSLVEQGDPSGGAQSPPLVDIKTAAKPGLAPFNRRVGDLEPCSRATCRLIVIEQRPVLRECLSRGLTSGFTQTIAAYSSVDDYLAASRPENCSLVVLSVARMADADTKVQISTLLNTSPKHTIVLLSQEDDPAGALDAFAVGAAGCIPMSLGFEKAIAALRFIDAGGTYLPPEYLVICRSHTRSHSSNDNIVLREKLTARQTQVLNLICDGKSNKQIARELGVAENTVKVHAHSLAKLLGVHDRRQFAARVRAKAWLDGPLEQ